MSETIKLDNIHSTEWAVRQRAGEWVLVKRHSDYAIYHAPENEKPLLVPTAAVDPLQRGMINPRLSYAVAREALKRIAAEYPMFERTPDNVRDLREFLAD